MAYITITDEFFKSNEMQYAIQQGYSFTNPIRLESQKMTTFKLSGPNLEKFESSDCVEMIFISNFKRGFSWDIKIRKRNLK